MADYTERANQKLVDAIHALKASNGENTGAEQIVMEEMAGAEFIMPVRIVGEKARERKLLYGVTANKDGAHFYMVFTSRANLKAWFKSEPVQSVKHSFEEAADIAMNDRQIYGFVLNPGTDDFIVAREMIIDLRTKIKGAELGLEGEKSSADEDIIFKNVREDQTTADLLNALTGAMRSDRNVAAGYIRDMVRNGHTDYCVIVRHIGSMDETFPRLMAAARRASRGRPVALLSARAPIAAKAIEGQQPFYQRAFKIVEQ